MKTESKRERERYANGNPSQILLDVSLAASQSATGGDLRPSARVEFQGCRIQLTPLPALG